MGDFAYLVPPLPADETTELCVDLFIPMVWVNSLLFFCVASDMAADLANLYIADSF